MGISVSLQDGRGNEIEVIHDVRNVLHRVLPTRDDSKYCCANTIDWYGDTTFNQYQTVLLRREWSILIKNAQDCETRALLEKIDSLLLRCESGDLKYVKFIGD